MRGGYPQVIPYQGSKRMLADRILCYFPTHPVARLIEPFAGSAAITVAALASGRARAAVVGDSLEPLVGIHRLIADAPEDLSEQYAALWVEQGNDRDAQYRRVRDEFNTDGDPAKLLYLLARCVKGSVRFNSYGLFNQSADRRRAGARPAEMARRIRAVHEVYCGRSAFVAADYTATLADADQHDLVFMDPPWQGTSEGRDQRYHRSLDRGAFLCYLDDMNRRGLRFLLSFDGSCGDRTYGEPMPSELRLTRIPLEAGRSSQATLSGRSESTVESLYLSPALAQQIDVHRDGRDRSTPVQLRLDGLGDIGA